MHGTSSAIPAHERDSETRIVAAIARFEQMTPTTILAINRGDNNLFHHDDMAAFEDLPSHNLPFGRAVYSTFGESQNVNDRKLASYTVGFLTKADRESGVQLWHNLVRDPDAEVRDIAIELIDEAAAEATPTNADEHLKECTGLTWHDAFNLYRAYVNAEQGRGIYQPGGQPTWVREHAAAPRPAQIEPRQFLGSTALARLRRRR